MDGTGIVLVLADNVSITADEPITVVVANEGATVSLAGATGGAEVIALENNVAVTDAPVGTTIAAKEGVTGTTANGQTVAPDSEITITAPSTGGGSVLPVILSLRRLIVLTKLLLVTRNILDEDEQEYVTGDGDEKEYVNADDLQDLIDNADVIVVDDKEYVKGDDGEWYDIKEDPGENNPVTSDEIIGGSNEQEGVD